MLDDLFSESSSSTSSSEEDDDELLEVLHCLQTFETRKCRAQSQNLLTATFTNGNNKEFQKCFRINKAAFNALVQMLKPSLEKDKGQTGKPGITAEMQLLSILSLLASPETYSTVGQRFNLSKSSLFTCFRRVIRALNEIAPEVIKWPTRDERKNVKERFGEIAGLRGVIGAIDTAYVRIRPPRKTSELYMNKHGFPSITLQAICDTSLKFTDCFAKYPSSTDNTTVFKKSDIYKLITENQIEYFDCNEYIIGDRAYPLFNWCISPYSSSDLTDKQHKFNAAHKSTCRVVKRSFALLLGRFCRLRNLDMSRFDLIPATITAACVLHNVCLSHNDEMVDNYIEEGMKVVFNDKNEGVQVPLKVQKEGRVFRDNLATYL